MMGGMNKQAFQKLYARLNAAQRQAVDSIEGPVMVIAGPGTGKTQVLAARIANILKQTDTAPQTILALTFTDAAATTMRERLFSMIGSTAYQVRIQTFHSFCDEIIRSHPDYFELGLEAEPLSELELTEFLRDYLAQPQLQYLRSPRSQYHYLHAIRQALQNIKREGYFVADFRQLVKEEEERQPAFAKPALQVGRASAGREKERKRLGKLQELADLYAVYQQHLADKNRYDFEDMILKVIAAFEQHAELLLEYQEQLHYFLVDEYQDTNSAQNKILDLLASYWSDNANVFVVGDPNQTIYRFQGASFENVLSFLDRYPQAVTINLEQGYRCSQDIYNAAAQVLAGQAPLPESPELFSVLKRPLQGRSEKQTTLKLTETSSDTAEQLYIVDEIKKLLKQKIAPADIAILVKKNKELTPLVETLTAAGIPYQLEKEQDILQTELIRQLLTIMQTILELRTGESAYQLYEVLLYDWTGLSTLEVLQLTQVARQRQVDLPAVLKKNPLVFAYYQHLLSLGRVDLNLTFTEWFPEFLEVTGLRAYLLNQKNPLTLQLLRTFYTEIQTIARSEKDLKLARFLEIIAALQAQGIGISRKLQLGEAEGVTLSTVHSAKGKEWGCVFLPQLVDGQWGNARSPLSLPLPNSILRFQAASKQDKNEDDRRLFYVGLTRARQQISLSFAQVRESDGKQQLPSQFVAELIESQTALKQSSYAIDETSLLKHSDELIPGVVIHNKDKAFTDWLRGLVANFQLSPSSLDIYLRDKETFFYSTLLRLPQATTSSLAFGTAVHQALEFVMRQGRQSQSLPKLATVLSVFKKKLLDQQLAVADFALRLRQGESLLAAYYENVKNFDLGRIQTVEQNFGTPGRPVILDKDIYLRGKVDRIDWVDTAQKTVKLVDYKTGDPKSRNHIEGKIKSANLSEGELALPESIRGRYKRQLVFYQLLTELDPNFKPKVVEAELDFVEAAEKGKKGRVSFTITDEEVDDLKQVIRQVIAEIRNLEFILAE